MIAAEDPDAVIMGCNKDQNSAQWASKLGKTAGVDMNQLFNIVTTGWGRGIHDMQQTTFLFWIASDKLTSVKQLKAKLSISNDRHEVCLHVQSQHGQEGLGLGMGFGVCFVSRVAVFLGRVWDW